MSWAGQQNASARAPAEAQARAVTARGVDDVAAQVGGMRVWLCRVCSLCSLQFAAADEVLDSLCLGIAGDVPPPPLTLPPPPSPPSLTPSLTASVWDDLLLDTAQMVAAM